MNVFASGICYFLLFVLLSFVLLAVLPDLYINAVLLQGDKLSKILLQLGAVVKWNLQDHILTSALLSVTS